jgi:histidyl-tRNA synthetase
MSHDADVVETIKRARRTNVFISHASEDKESVAIPLADALRRAGLKVWLDKSELTIGDSLRASIDARLSESRFGVVIISATEALAETGT